jgi:imidazolonepropionase-like amidohydrolase
MSSWTVRVVLSAMSLVFAAGDALAQNVPAPLAIVNARIYPVTSAPIASGTIVVRGGKIAAVGARVPVPAGARVIDARGKHVIPGIVESHSHAGLKVLWRPTTGSYNNELSKPINAEVRAIDGLDTSDPAFAVALEGGVTTMNITTGSRSPNSGQAVVVKLRGGDVDDMYLTHGGMKFAIRADRQFDNFPPSTDEVRALLASRLSAAQDYVRRWKEHTENGRTGVAPDRDLELEAFGKLLTREWPVGVHAHSASDMAHAIALKREFGLDLYVHHANATGVHTDELVQLGIPVSYGPLLPFTSADDSTHDGVVSFVRRGGRLSLHQDHPDGHQYWLRPGASLLVRRGLSEADALRALTLNPAALFRLESRIGSLEVGKDADIVILSGPPLEFESLVERVFIDGREVYNRASGYNVFVPQPSARR